jgi:hypothetical protein
MKLLLYPLLILFALPLRAEQAKDLGDYVVHYIAFTTDTLPPEVARNYGITRSRSRGMINITVLKKGAGIAGKPVPAAVEVSAVNMSNQYRSVPVREIRDGEAIYYIGEFNVSNEDALDFHIQVHPEKTENSYEIRYRQEFFTR